MPKIDINDEQVLNCLDQLSPKAKRAALNKLIDGLEHLDRIVDRNMIKIQAICQERGIAFDHLKEDERETLIDEILHESPKEG
jgi:hypothetical protein